jgi:hypothetical protein
MTGDVPPAANTPAPPMAPPRAPGNRVSGGLIVALVVAALMLLGVVGLVAAALLGDDDEPTGAGLGPQVNVESPATAAPAETTTDDGSAATAPDMTPAEASSGEDSSSASAADASESTSSGPATSGDDAEASPSGDDDFSDDPSGSLPSITTLPGVDDIEPPASEDLPEPADGPVVLPVQVTTPTPPSTFPALPFDDVGPGSVTALDGWGEHDRSADHLAFTRDDEMVEVFVIDGVATADAALETFYDDVRPELEELTRSPMTRLGAPSARFLSVAGSEYIATTARQQGTSTMSGTIVTAVRPDGTAVVLTTSRAGESSADELAADAVLLEAILAQL